jgi:hypothetical protein
MLTTALIGPYHKRYLATECVPGYDIYDMEIDAMKTGRPLQWVDCGEVSGDVVLADS